MRVMSKDWVGNQNSIFKCLGASNHTEDEREINDYYATDPSAIDDLLKVERFNSNIWECACGEGHLSKRLEDYGYNVLSSDLIDRGYENALVMDFLEQDNKFDGDIITNPPYKYCSEFILKALELINDGNKVSMFLKLTTLEGQKRYEEIFDDGCGSVAVQLCRRNGPPDAARRANAANRLLGRATHRRPRDQRLRGGDRRRG